MYRIAHQRNVAVVLGVHGVNRALHAALLRGGLGVDGSHLHHGVLRLGQLRLVLAVVRRVQQRARLIQLRGERGALSAWQTRRDASRRSPPRS